jgi:hypothetical protein
MEFDETVPENDIRGIRGGSYATGDALGKWNRPVDMHSSDEFHDLGFRVASLVAPAPEVPALPGAAPLVLLLSVGVAGATALRQHRRRARTG